MIRAWLDMHPAEIFASLAALYLGVMIIFALLAFRSPLKRPLQAVHGIVAPFFGAVAILFALLAGFLANDISDRGREALRAVQTEAGELHNIHTLSVASASDMTSIRAALKTYVSAVITQEWPAMDHGHESPAATTAFDDLLKEVSRPSVAAGSGAPIQAALLGAAVRAGTARNLRLSLATNQTNDLKWLVVIVLGLFTEIAIGLVHLDKPRAFVTALSLFSCAVIVTLGILALQEYPFSGSFRISPAPISALQALGD